jgi:hypothetical protein
VHLPGNDDEYGDQYLHQYCQGEPDEQSAIDELHALDDYAPVQPERAGTEQGASELDALDDYVREPAEHTEADMDDLDLPTEDEDEVPVALFTVTNPAGTVSVSAQMDGSIHQVELSAKATSMTESELAAEIIVIADLAQQSARSAQHTFILEKMTEAGADDTDAIRDFLGEGMGLPTPEQVAAAQAEVFATRYRD